MNTPKADCEVVMNAILPFAEQMLRDHGEFFPFGGAMLVDRKIVPVAGFDGTGHVLSNRRMRESIERQC
jgi:hypothetical protein